MQNQIKVITSAAFTERDIATIGVAVTGMGHFLSCGRITHDDLEMTEEETTRFLFCLNQVANKLETLQDEVNRERKDRESHSSDNVGTGD